jgi:NADH:ubiquinone reductase (non-electrogenic)
MEKAMTLVLATMATLFVAGDACDNIPSITWKDTCEMACKTPRLFDICQEALKDSLYIQPMTVYAAAAAKYATKTYDGTVDQMAKIVASGLPGDERAAYLSCIDRYATARIQMEAAIADMNACQFARTTQEYVEALAGVKTCGEKLSAGWPLVAVIANDLDVTTVAANLGGLVISRSSSRP